VVCGFRGGLCVDLGGLFCFFLLFFDLGFFFFFFFFYDCELFCLRIGNCLVRETGGKVWYNDIVHLF